MEHDGGVDAGPAVRSGAGRMKARPCGAVLWLILPLLSLLTVLAVGASRSLAVEQRATRNLAEQRALWLAAMQALQAAERRVLALNAYFDGELANGRGKPWQGDGRAPGWFMPDCLSAGGGLGDGLCATAPALWRRSAVVQGRRWPLLHPCGASRSLAAENGRVAGVCVPPRPRAGQPWSAPRYLVELLNPAFRPADGASGRLYRISLRVWGDNEGRALTLQSWFWAGVGARAQQGGRLNWRQAEEEE